MVVAEYCGLSLTGWVNDTCCSGMCNAFSLNIPFLLYVFPLYGAGLCCLLDYKDVEYSSAAADNYIQR